MGRRDVAARQALGRSGAGQCALLAPVAAVAYTAVGDRVFPATVLLAQAAPGDALYMTPSTRPVPGDCTNLTTTLDKRGSPPRDKLIGFVEQPLRRAPEGEIYRAALLLVVEGAERTRLP